MLLGRINPILINIQPLLTGGIKRMEVKTRFRYQGAFPEIHCIVSFHCRGKVHPEMQ
jgi:hypothetical protein